MDAIVTRNGIAAAAELQAASRSLSSTRENGDSSWIGYVIGIAYTLPFVGYSIWSGYLSGRYHPIMSILKHRQDAEVEIQDTRLRSNPVVQAFLRNLSGVRDLTRQQSLLDERIKENARP